MLLSDGHWAVTGDDGDARCTSVDHQRRPIGRSGSSVPRWSWRGPRKRRAEEGDCREGGRCTSFHGYSPVLSGSDVSRPAIDDQRVRAGTGGLRVGALMTAVPSGAQPSSRFAKSTWARVPTTPSGVVAKVHDNNRFAAPRGGRRGRTRARRRRSRAPTTRKTTPIMRRGPVPSTQPMVYADGRRLRCNDRLRGSGRVVPKSPGGPDQCETPSMMIRVRIWSSSRRRDRQVVRVDVDLWTVMRVSSIADGFA